MQYLELAAEHSIHLKAENMAEKLEWMSKIRACIESTGQGDSAKSSKDSVKSFKDSDSNGSARPGSAVASSVSAVEILHYPPFLSFLLKISSIFFFGYMLI